MHEIKSEYSIAFQNHFSHKRYIVRCKVLYIKALQEGEITKIPTHSNKAFRLLEEYYEWQQEKKSHDSLENQTNEGEIPGITNRENYFV